jgi:hypothetical protein
MNNNTKTIAALACMTLLVLTPIAIAQDAPPRDSQLRSAYCVPVTRWRILELRRTVELSDRRAAEARKEDDKFRDDMKQELARTEALLAQLEAHALGRPVAEGTPVAQAVNKGADDVNEYLSMSQRCSAKCYSAGPKIDQCQADCRDSALMNRIQACFNPDWPMK